MNELTGAIPAHLMDRPDMAVPDKTSMGKDDFMKLLMAQLQNQDPLNPMDHKEFAAQLAQFASLEKLSHIGSGIDKLEGGMGEEAKLQALGMIGKNVKANGAEVSLIENQSVDIRLNNEGGFRPTKVSIFGGDGKLVREMDVDPKKDGSTVTWDGKNNEGAGALAGKYQFRVAGIGPDGKAKEMEASLQGKVIGVEMIDKNPMLLVDTPNGQTKVELSKVLNIGEQAGKTEKKASPEKQATEQSPAEDKATPSSTSDRFELGWPGASTADNRSGWVGYRP